MNLNENYLRLSDSDPFAILEKKVTDHQFLNPDRVIVRLDTEDSPFPLPACVPAAMDQAARQLQEDPSLRKVPPVNGYPFLIGAIREYYAARNIPLFDTEIFVNDGAKCDIAGILELSSTDNTVLITEPFNPIYYNANLAAGRNIRFVSADSDGSLLPSPDEEHADIIYLCSPCNPTGVVYPHELLQKWVDYALYHGALILFDASYEAFLRSPELPRSIYEIEGAKKCAVEICSLSKAAGFANTRLGYTVIPNNLIFDSIRLNQLWMRRERLKFNGVSYVVQKGAQAAFSKEGQDQIRQIADGILDTTRYLNRSFATLGLCDRQEVHSPNLWIRCPDSMSSWECFDWFLKEAGVVAIPGSLFGSCGERYMKMTGYVTPENARLAVSRLSDLLGRKECERE